MIASGLGLSLALVSAVTSVVSHAFLKAGEDRLAIRVWCCLIELALMLPVVLWRGALPLALWPYVAGFGVIGATYHLLLLRSYRLSDFSAAYPVARGEMLLWSLLEGQRAPSFSTRLPSEIGRAHV